MYDVKYSSTKKKYEQLVNIKYALGIGMEEETSALQILEKAKKHNKKEVFLLEYIINQIKNMPLEIKRQYDKLIEEEVNENFSVCYRKVSAMYEIHPVFKWYYGKIYKELYFDIIENQYYFNSLIYEIAYREIEHNSIFSSNNPVMNLYLLQKSLKKHKLKQRVILSTQENLVLNLLLQGYLEEEIESITNIDAEAIHDITKSILPSKFNVDSVIQVLAIYLK